MNSKIIDWLANGETGVSSKRLAFIALGAQIESSWSDNPHDPADFNRCLKLVALAPEIKAVFPKVREISFEWRQIIDHWDELEKMFVSEVGWDWSESNEAPKTYARMRELFAPES